MKKSKGRFEINYKGINSLLKSQACQDIARKEAEKLGTIEEEYVGTQRAWVKGKE